MLVLVDGEGSRVVTVRGSPSGPRDSAQFQVSRRSTKKKSAAKRCYCMRDPARRERKEGRGEGKGKGVVQGLSFTATAFF